MRTNKTPKSMASRRRKFMHQLEMPPDDGTICLAGLYAREP